MSGLVGAAGSGTQIPKAWSTFDYDAVERREVDAIGARGDSKKARAVARYDAAQAALD